MKQLDLELSLASQQDDPNDTEATDWAADERDEAEDHVIVAIRQYLNYFSLSELLQIVTDEAEG